MRQRISQMQLLDKKTLVAKSVIDIYVMLIIA